MPKLLLFDLDGTLLRSDKTLSDATLAALGRARARGHLIGVSTSRSEQNCLSFLGRLDPDILITSGGALVRRGQTYLRKAAFSAERTAQLIAAAREVCGEDTEISIDTADTHYWNYTADPHQADQSWGETVWTDFRDFSGEALKMCVQIFDECRAAELEARLTDCDAARFSDGYWYKYTMKNVTKENALPLICGSCGITARDIIAFGDDWADIGMLRLAGLGVAMGNAIPEVKAAADLVIGSNDEDGIALYLDSLL